jgi:hypothetical protein
MPPASSTHLPLRPDDRMVKSPFAAPPINPGPRGEFSPGDQLTITGTHGPNDEIRFCRRGETTEYHIQREELQHHIVLPEQLKR